MLFPRDDCLPVCEHFRRKKTKKRGSGERTGNCTKTDVRVSWVSLFTTVLFICVTYSAIQNEATEKDDVLACVFWQAAREILLSGEYKTTRQAIKRVLILNQARHQLFIKFVCQSLTLLVLVAIVFIHSTNRWDDSFSVMWRRREKEKETHSFKMHVLDETCKTRITEVQSFSENNVNYNLHIRFKRLFTRNVVGWKRACS